MSFGRGSKPSSTIRSSFSSGSNAWTRLRKRSFTALQLDARAGSQDPVDITGGVGRQPTRCAADTRTMRPTSLTLLAVTVRAASVAHRFPEGRTPPRRLSDAGPLGKQKEVRARRFVQRARQGWGCFDDYESLTGLTAPAVDGQESGESPALLLWEAGFSKIEMPDIPRPTGTSQL
jgi:hypothetical protein